MDSRLVDSHGDGLVGMYLGSYTRHACAQVTKAARCLGTTLGKMKALCEKILRRSRVEVFELFFVSRCCRVWGSRG